MLMMKKSGLRSAGGTSRSRTGSASDIFNKNCAFKTMRASFMKKDFLEEMRSTQLIRAKAFLLTVWSAGDESFKLAN